MRGSLFVFMLILLGCLFGCDALNITPSKPSADEMAYDVANAAITLASTPGGAPTPSPTPSPGRCVNCNDVGWVGDGTNWVACQVCNADERKPRPRRMEGGDSSTVVPAPTPDLKAAPQSTSEATVKETSATLTPAFDKTLDKLKPSAELPPKVNTPQQTPVSQALPNTPQRAPPINQIFVDDNNWHWSHPGTAVTHLLSTQHGFTVMQLNGRSIEELETIHDWLHEGKITREKVFPVIK